MGKAKITKEQVIALLTEANEKGTPVSKLEVKYGICNQHVYNILRNKKWKSIDRTPFANLETKYGFKKALNYKQIKEIKRLVASGEVKRKEELAVKFDVSIYTINRVLTNNYSAFTSHRNGYLTVEQIYV